MAALKGTLPLRNIHLSPFWRNYSDQDGRAFSPEQNKKIILATGVISPPSALPNAAFLTDARIGLASGNRTRLSAGRRNEVLPITNNPALNQRNNIRGEGNTGRWKMLGKSPKDGMGIGFDYWEQILVNPNVVDLGNVVSDTIFNVTVLNTYRRDNKTITAIDNNAGAGITVEGATPPANLQPLQDRVYAVTVGTTGPPNISGSIDFVTTDGTLTVTVSGTRIIIFPYPPQREIVERLEWLTDVLRKADGSEQRFSLRTDPRQKVNYEILLDNGIDDINNVRNLLFDWTTRVFGVPLWWDEQALRADVVINDLTVFIRDNGLRYSDFRVGGLAMVYQEFDDGTFQTDVLEIASIQTELASPEATASSITFATPILNNYDGNVATIVPVLPGILVDNAKQSTTRNSDLVSYKLNFEMLDNLNSYSGVDVAWYAELPDFDGKNALVIEDKNMIENELSEIISQVRQRIDFGIGRVTQLTQETKGRRSAPFQWKVEDDSFAWQLRALLAHLRGKWQAVWLPTWRNDFIVNTNIGNGSINIDVDNHGFARYVGATQKWAGLRLEKTDGSLSYHRITNSAEIDATTERLTIEPATSFAATVAEVSRVDLMVLSRQNTDSITIVHSWNDAQSDAIDETFQTEFVGDVR